MRPSSRRGGTWAAVVVAGVLAAACPSLVARASEAPQVSPGQTIRIRRAELGVNGYCEVYVPRDYDSDELWPVLFYYHGLGGRPDTRRMQHGADGKYCIVVAMSYYARGMKGYEFLASEDVRILRTVLGLLKKRLCVNERRLYVAGFSKGGFYACEMLRRLPDLFAGAIVLGAGSKHLDAPWPPLDGKEVFIGCGQRDRFLPMAKETAKRLTALGATVTFQQWPATGHGVGDIQGLRRWVFEKTVVRPPAPRASDPAGGVRRGSRPAGDAGDQLGASVVLLTAGLVALAGVVVAGVVVLQRRKRGRAGTCGEESPHNEDLA